MPRSRGGQGAAMLGQTTHGMFNFARVFSEIAFIDVGCLWLGPAVARVYKYRVKGGVPLLVARGSGEAEPCITRAVLRRAQD